jgi:hypothetical protein
MADIDIVPKQRSNVWIWVVLAIVVVLALYFLLGRGTHSTTTGALHQQPQPVASIASAGPPLA